MRALLLLAAAALAGCASQPMTPEQAAVFMQYQQNQQAASNAQWQQMQTNPLFQRMPDAPRYQAPAYTAPVYQQPPRTINCTTTGGAYALHTTCR